jgi:hypothetical protein
MASRERVTSACAPDLDEIRAWLQKMIAALRFVEMVTAIVALFGRMRDLNTATRHPDGATDRHDHGAR